MTKPKADPVEAAIMRAIRVLQSAPPRDEDDEVFRLLKQALMHRLHWADITTLAMWESK